MSYICYIGNSLGFVDHNMLSKLFVLLVFFFGVYIYCTEIALEFRRRGLYLVLLLMYL